MIDHLLHNLRYKTVIFKIIFYDSNKSNNNNIDINIDIKIDNDNRGGLFLEAPVSGSKVPADMAQLIFLCAGNEEVIPWNDILILFCNYMIIV